MGGVSLLGCSPCHLAKGLLAVSALFPAQTGEIVALKKVALRRLEDGIPNQALREIKALQEIEDSQYVSGAGLRWAGRAWVDQTGGGFQDSSFSTTSIHFHSSLSTHIHFKGVPSNLFCVPACLPLIMLPGPLYT